MDCVALVAHVIPAVSATTAPGPSLQPGHSPMSPPGPAGLMTWHQATSGRFCRHVHPLMGRHALTDMAGHERRSVRPRSGLAWHGRAVDGMGVQDQ